MQERKKKRVLVMIDWFDPAFKAGGPIRSTINFVYHMHQDFELYVFTGDKDLGSVDTLTGIETEKWVDYKGKAKVYYCPATGINSRKVANILGEVNPDCIYLNSFFSVKFSLIPLWLLFRGKVSARIILAPRGMLRKSALAFKPTKKKVFLQVFKYLGLHHKVQFQATDQQEEKDILSNFRGAKVTLAPNLPGIISDRASVLAKQAGSIRILFVGRVHPIKNVLYLLKRLSAAKGQVICTIIGAREDAQFSEDCIQFAKSLPSSVKVEFTGEKPHDEITKAYGQNHLFFLPTMGENFGHAIFEALSAGCPVLISDQTPWRGLEYLQAGWDISLESPVSFEEALNKAIEWDQEEYNRWSNGAVKKAKDFIAQSPIRESYLKLFN